MMHSIPRPSLHVCCVVLALNTAPSSEKKNANSRGNFDLGLLIFCIVLCIGWGIFGSIWIQSHGGDSAVEACKVAAPALYGTAVAMKGILIAVGVLISVFTLLCRIEHLYDDVSENTPHLLSHLDGSGISGEAKESNTNGII